MGCGCGGRRAGAQSRGTTPNEPIIFGTDDAGLPVRYVRVLQASGGTPQGATRYVRGSKVDEMIESSKLEIVG